MFGRFVLAIGLVTVSCAPAVEERLPAPVVDGEALLESLERLVEDQWLRARSGSCPKTVRSCFGVRPDMPIELRTT